MPKPSAEATVKMLMLHHRGASKTLLCKEFELSQHAFEVLQKQFGAVVRVFCEYEDNLKKTNSSLKTSLFDLMREIELLRAALKNQKAPIEPDP